MRTPAWRLLVLLALVLAPTLSGPAPAEQAANSPLPTADEVIARLQEGNRRREGLLESYSCRRRYLLANELTEKRSEVEVEMRFRHPDRMEFRILRQTGSGFLAKRVFGRMMQAEKDALTAENKRRSALTPENYTFTLEREETLGKRRAYVIGVKPKRKDTYLIEGRVWIDAEDFAIVRATGRPSKKPSIWVRKVDFVRGYRKVGPFWLPDRLETISEVILFGQTRVAIETGDYQIRLRPAAPVAAQK